MSKELVLKEGQLTSAAMAEHLDFPVEEFKDIALDVTDSSELFSNDILIPKIWLVQAMSELRKAKKADEGQFVDSQTEEVIAESDTGFNFVVLKTFKRWHTFELVKEKNEIKKNFVSSEIMVLGKNHNLPYEETVEGKDLVRRQVISAYILLERDAAAGLEKPYIIDFASTSKLAGRTIVSDIKTLNSKGAPSFVGFFHMTSEEQAFEKGEAFVKKAKFGGYTPKSMWQFLKQCRMNLDTMENQIEIDDSDLVATTATKVDDANVAAKVDDKTGANI